MYPLRIKSWLCIGSTTLCPLLSFALDVGDTEKQVLEELGPPRSKIELSHIVTYFYCDGTVDVKNGKVIRLDEGVGTMHHHAETNDTKNAAFEAEQKKKGLVLHKGKWIPKERADFLKALENSTTPRLFTPKTTP